ERLESLVGGAEIGRAIGLRPQRTEIGFGQLALDERVEARIGQEILGAVGAGEGGEQFVIGHGWPLRGIARKLVGSDAISARTCRISWASRLRQAYTASAVRSPRAQTSSTDRPSSTSQ